MSADKKLKVFLDNEEDIFIFDGDPTEGSKDIIKIWKDTYCKKCRQKFTEDDLYKGNFELYINRKASWLEEGSRGFQIETTDLMVRFAVSDIEHKKCSRND